MIGPELFGDTEALLREYDAQRLIQAVEIGLLGQREGQVDPLKHLLDPAFTETMWLYEASQTEPNAPGRRRWGTVARLGVERRATCSRGSPYALREGPR